MRFQPKGSWFLAAFVLFVVLSAPMWEPWPSAWDWVSVIYMAPVYVACFPLGLVAPAGLLNGGQLGVGLSLISGWLVYLSLLRAGMTRPRRELFLVFVLLLVTNAIGCHVFKSSFTPFYR